MTNELSFRPIRLSEHFEFCLQAEIDAYRISFGTADEFYELFGPKGEKYFEWLKNKLNDPVASAVHVWKSGQIIGQVLLGTRPDDPQVGYVFLYYLIPQMRGKGFGRILNEYAEDFLRKAGFRRIRLSVTDSNSTALNFYKKMSWRELGPSPKRPGVLLMEKNLAT